MTEPLYATPIVGPHNGRRITALAAGFGTSLLPWQRLAAAMITERVPGTDFRRHSQFVMTSQRRSGKTKLIKSVVADRCLCDGPSRRVWYTAQSGKYARDVWNEIVAELTGPGSPLAGTIAVMRSQGSEVATFPNGSTFSPFPPTRDALHGKDGDLILVDEAWRHSAARGAEIMQAVNPIMATRPSAQLVILSAAGTVDSVWFREFVEQGRAGELGYLEYGIGDDGDPTDLDLVVARHPAAGLTVPEQFIRAQAAVLPPGEFARAYGNAWTRTLEPAIPPDLWTARATDQPIPDGSVVLAAEVAQDDSRGAIVAAAGGIVEVIYSGPVAGLVPRLLGIIDRQQPAAVAIARTGPSAAVADAVAAAGVEVLSPTTDYATACKRAMDDLTAGLLHYRHHPALSMAAADAVRRNIGDGWVWARRQSAGPIPELIGMTLAHWYDLHRPAVLPAPMIRF